MTMTIAGKIGKVARRLTFYRKLPEFIDRAKYLEGRLREGEYLTVEMEDLELTGRAKHSADMMVLDLHRKHGGTIRAISLDSLGTISWFSELFRDYRPLPESQRYPDN
jgi:hypothetical protein